MRIDEGVAFTNHQITDVLASPPCFLAVPVEIVMIWTFPKHKVGLVVDAAAHVTER
jgi:hypothetical protein